MTHQNSLALKSFLLLACSAFCSAAGGEENAGPNANLLRTATGLYEYRALSDDRDRGRERFELMVHKDGSRTLLMWHDLWAINAQFSVVLRVAKDFRPISAYTSYWVSNGFKGNTLFQVDGDTVTAHGMGTAGPVQQTVEVPPQFSIGSHPVSGDGWHLWYADDTEAGDINLFSLEASTDTAKPILGQLVQMPYEVVGQETIETPAGQFATTHYRLMGKTDLWVTGEDRILVKMVQPSFDRIYELVELQTN
jgi:hypothetical protein